LRPGGPHDRRADDIGLRVRAQRDVRAQFRGNVNDADS
jgi:hypothetical protein